MVDTADLSKVRQVLAQAHNRLEPAAENLKKSAHKALRAPLLHVTEKKHLPPSGDNRDYFSIGTYWWPNPDAPNGLPYVRRDGRINPESMDSDTGRVRTLCQRCWHLALAYYLFDDDACAARCAEQLHAWFLDPESAMHPHLRYAQSIPGRVDGRSLGIIDTRDFRYVLDAASLILGTPHWPQYRHAGLRQWMNHFLDWLLQSRAGQQENAENNNHGTWYSVQVLALALFCGRLPLARQLAQKAARRIETQITNEGEQPREFVRSRPLTYCTMNLHAFFDAATLAEAVDIDLWHHRAPNGAGLEKAARWLLPFVQKERAWPEREIISYEPENYFSVFRRAALHYDAIFEPECLPLNTDRTGRELMQLVYPRDRQHLEQQERSTMSARGETAGQIAKHWDSIDQRKRTRWWHKRVIIEEINRRVCGQPLPRISQGAAELASRINKGRPFRHGVSVGGGSGSKEIALLKSGLVERLTLFELSPGRIEAGRRAAEKQGLGARIEFIQEDAFAADIADGQFDLVHWNNALHHMFDVDAALAWSRRVLSRDGLLYVDDYIGPNRFQWSDATLALASRVRQSLPEAYLRREGNPEERVPVQVGRPSVRRIVGEDPSEAPDSERTLESLKKHFPNALVIPTGGAVYNLALTHTLHNFDDDNPADQALLRSLMLVDETAVNTPGVESHYAVALAWRSGQRIRITRPDWTGQQPGPRRQLPLWQRIARRILPAAVREPLNRINLARHHWQTAARKKLDRKPERKRDRGAPKGHHADPEGPFHCPLCANNLTGFVPGGHYRRPNAKCPACGALERHRAAWLLLQHNADWLDPAHGPVRLLHVAPEPPMARRLQALEHIEYLSADIEPGRAMVTMDLTEIDLPDEQFDIIFCSHVLEHIPDDGAAMREMHRILKTDGTAYIQVPLRRGKTHEDFSITSPEGRKEAFGQEDHVRIYGTDIADRLQAAGFRAELRFAAKELPSDARHRMNTGNSCLIECAKSRSGAS